jgi:hypothetical protein
MATAVAPTALRVAAVWGTTVVALRTLERGDSFTLGDHEGADLPIPDGIEMSPAPVHSAQGGWDLDARGAVGGLLTLRGRGEDPVALARAGTPVPIMPGDYGLIQYGQFAIFFQYTSQPIALPAFRGPEILTLLAIFSSAVLHLGMLGLIRTLMTPPPLAKPLELTNPEEWAAKFGLHRPIIETPPPVVASNDSGGSPAAEGPKKDMKSGGKAIKGPQGAAGLNGAEKTTQITGPVRETQHYGGLSDVLEGETGKEIQNTLKSINNVSAALAGLNSSTIVLGSGPGTGLKGAGSGGGGTGNGVMFGTGAVDTGFGSGAGGLGGGGTGGRGAGGKGGGNGTGSGNGNGPGGPGEKNVTADPEKKHGPGGLSPEQVRRVVMGRIGAIRACYEGEAQKNPGLKGGVTVAWTIDPAGNVAGASLAGTTLNNPRVEGCVLRQVRSWHFPTAESPTTVAGFPFKFGVGG